MSATRPTPLAPSVSTQLAKAALRRLALAQAEPTPENYARAYDEELGVAPRPVLPPPLRGALERMAAALLRDEAERASLVEAFVKGQPGGVERIVRAVTAQEAAQAEALAALFRGLVRGLERADRQWTLARKKESLRTVFDNSRCDAQRLQHRLTQLIASWERDAPANSIVAELDAPPAAARPAPAASIDAPEGCAGLVEAIGMSLGRALPGDDSSARALAAALSASLVQFAREGASAEMEAALRRHAADAERLLQRRHALLGQTQALCGELTGALTDLAEDESWSRGQCQAMQAKLDEGLSARGLRSVSALLHHTRARQRELRAEREQARDALKSLIHQMLQQVGELGSHTGRFTDNVARYADVIEHADSLESLAGAVREMVAESRTVQDLVGAAQQRLQDEHARASDLSQRVKSLEDELRHLSEEVSTDPLTQVANRRGLLRTFDSERAQAEGSGAPLALGLIDIDDFKRLNDRLGHGAGDEALKSLVRRVQQSLRPSDTVARYGGEEFVVVLPATPLEEAQQVLTRAQRATTEALFLHESTPVFVTFSAGVTMYRPGERLEEALDRADEALYEAKRTGKNRTCAA
jgi:diguanylate cyclase